jgi:hypothetical protein
VAIDGAIRARGTGRRGPSPSRLGIFRTDLSSLTPVETPSTQDLAMALLDRYLIAFEVASVLLLAAIISAVVLARRRDPAPEGTTAPEAAALGEGSVP